MFIIICPRHILYSRRHHVWLALVFLYVLWSAALTSMKRKMRSRCMPSVLADAMSRYWSRADCEANQDSRYTGTKEMWPECIFCAARLIWKKYLDTYLRLPDTMSNRWELQSRWIHILCAVFVNQPEHSSFKIWHNLNFYKSLFTTLHLTIRMHFWYPVTVTKSGKTFGQNTTLIVSLSLYALCDQECK